MEGPTLRDLFEIIGAVVTVGTILWRLSATATTFAIIGTQQAKEIGEIKVAVEKMETAVSAIAVQDQKITNLSTRMDLTDRRNDERFAQLDRWIEELRHGRGIIQQRT